METYSSLKDLNLEEKAFATKEEVKPWLQSNLLHSKGIKIVIERSDYHKIIFRCQDTREREIGQGNRRRQITCPFKVRANLSLRTKVWSLTVLNEFHNHSVPDKAMSYRGDKSTETLADSNFAMDMRNQEDGNGNGHMALKGDGPLKNMSFMNSEGHSSSDDHDRDQPPGTTINASVGSNLMGGQNSAGHKHRKVSKPRSKRTTKKVKEDKATPQLFDLLNEEYKDFELANDLGKKINDLINSQVTMNQQLDDESKANVLRLVINNLVSEHKEVVDETKLNTWFSSPTSTTQANANLIPLSPLLNESEADYPSNGALNGSLTGNQSSLESLTLPGINNNVLHNHSANSFVMPNQLQLHQIQNQNKQLPSFNSIQNNLPPSPGSMSLYNTLPTPANSINSTTLNPTLLNANKLAPANTTSTNLGSGATNYTTNSNTNNTITNTSLNSLLFDSKDKPSSFMSSLSTLLTNTTVPSPTNMMVKSSPFTTNHDHLPFKIRNESDNEQTM